MSAVECTHSFTECPILNNDSATVSGSVKLDRDADVLCDERAASSAALRSSTGLRHGIHGVDNDADPASLQPLWHE